MPSYDSKVKDKRIVLENSLYVAIVMYYQDTPARDEDAKVEKVFSSIPPAQKWLTKFPRDVWDGYDSVDYKYQETDERRRNERKRTQKTVTVTGEGRRGGHREVSLPGRSFVGRVRDPL